MEAMIHGAGGGKSGGGRAPKEAKNTLHTAATARIVDLVGEGPIRGPVDGLRSVFIDGVPVIGAGGEQNFEGLSIDWRLGTADQSPLAGIPEVESEVDVSMRVYEETPIVRRITSAATDSARVTLRFPRLVSYNDRGDSNATSVTLRIEVRGADQPYSTAVETVINDKNTAPAELSWRVTLPGDSPWDIRVTRLTPDSESDRLSDELWWARYTEIIELRQTYPYSAVVGITIDARQFSRSAVKREYEVYGRIISVPSNYDPHTRAYAGLWDGAFRPSWTDNPAWCAFDLLAARRFGLGSHLSPEAISASKWSFYALAQWCDEMVPDGRGGVEPRWRFSGVINKATEARRLITHMLSVCRARMYYGSGAVVAVHDAPADPISIVGPANTIDGEMSVSTQSWSDRVSAVAMSFSDPTNEYGLAVELVVDDDLVRRYGYRQADHVAMFTTSRGQAQRHARHILLKQEYESDELQYRGGLDQASLRPGDVIQQSDPQVAAARLAIRVTPSTSKVSLFDDLALDHEAVLYLDHGVMRADNNRAFVAIGLRTLAPVLGHKYDFIRLYQPGRAHGHVFVVNLVGRPTLPNEDRLAFVFRLRRDGDGGAEATAWLPLAGNDDPYTWGAWDFRRPRLPQTFREDIYAAPVTTGDRLHFDVALVRTDSSDIGPSTSRVTIPALRADSLESVPSGHGWRISYMLPDGGIAAPKNVIEIDGDTLIIDGEMNPPPAAGAMAVLEAPDVTARLWRIESVAERAGLEFEVRARAYHPDRYAAVERAAFITSPDLTLIPRGPLPAPAAVMIDEYLYLSGRDIKAAVTVAAHAPVRADPRVVYTEIEIRAPADPAYRPLATATANEAELRDAHIGLYYARARYVGEPPSLRSPWTESPARLVRGKTAPPAPPGNFLIDVLGDGTRRYRWTPPADLDFRGVQLAYAEHVVGGTMPDWEDLTALHTGVLTADHLEATEPQRVGIFVLAARSVDLGGRASDPVYIVASLGPTRGPDSILWECPSAIGWPGSYSGATRSNDGRDALEGSADYTWADVTSWDAWRSWGGGDGESHTRRIVYDRGPIDIGVRLSCSLGYEAQSIGVVTFELKISDDEAGLAGSAWQDASDGRVVEGRWIRVRWVLHGDGTEVLSLDHACWWVTAPSTEERLRDQDTALFAAPSTAAAGARELPTRLRHVTDVALTLQSVGPGWSWALMSKRPPIIIIYDAAGMARDALVDVVIRGVR